MITVNFVAATYHQDLSLKCFINSIKAQTSDNWRLYIIHDGEDEFYHKIKKELEDQGYLNDQIVFDHTPQKAENPWGHLSRDYAVDKYLSGDENEVTVMTNADNYYVPIFVEYLEQVFEVEGYTNLFYWNCVHSHENGSNTAYFPPMTGRYSLLQAQLQHAMIDLGCVAIRNNIVKQIGFKHEEHDGDWFYFNDAISLIKNPKEEMKKTNKVLFVHN